MNTVKQLGLTINQQEQLLEREIAKFAKERIGKGPSKTEVRIADNILICVQHGFLTKAEELIIESGHLDKVIDYRRVYIMQCVNDIEKIIYQVIDRKIKYFFPSWILEQNLSCWTIYLD
ncbi:Na-translocating system protein MpsC family protein [Sporomusa sp. KB1]|uniref:Na-translocating system protein MpsC family protein n=1 Tax=Sporomusa sp. KB1 TaxID=943346 RepID=UPI0011AD0E79|nr:Na-translocating system protein MpsC family protein [Sporomusa sp. KB1]TWH45597.1 uncharacterized protein YbcI [Sporomusa sp. KB1]